MKLRDIILFENDKPITSQGTYGGEFKRSWTPSPKAIGRGKHSSVKPDPRNPDNVIKHNIRPYPLPDGADNDGFNVFITYLIDNNLTGNPHFPRVNTVKTLTDKTGSRIHKYNMEKLQPSWKLTPQEFHDFVNQNLVDGVLGLSEEEMEYVDDDFLNNAMGAFVGALANNLPYNKPLAKSTELDQAVKIMSRILKETDHLVLDLNDENIMWRRDGAGLTLVFADPFSM